MNEIARLPVRERADRVAPVDCRTEPAPPPPRDKAGHHRGGWPLGAAVTLSLAGALGYGGWHDYAQRQQVAATAQQQHDLVPDVLVGQVRPSGR
jgi:hypothetical protein